MVITYLKASTTVTLLMLCKMDIVSSIIENKMAKCVMLSVRLFRNFSILYGHPQNTVKRKTIQCILLGHCKKKLQTIRKRLIHKTRKCRRQSF